jgi:hypothetical protein
MKKIFTILFILFTSIFTTVGVHAASKTADYSVIPQFSEHQSFNAGDYFDIKWTPGATDHFELKISNKTSKVKKFAISVNKARTNSNGIIDYSDNTAENTNTRYKITKMVQLEKEVTVAPNSNKVVSGSIDFPDKSFNGILMGGLHIAEEKGALKGNTISNTIAYNIPFVVRGNVNKRPVLQVVLDQVKVAKNAAGLYGLNASIDNQRANLLKKVEVVAAIKNEDNKTLSKTTSHLDITPETKFNYPIKLPKGIKAGKYKLVLKMKHDQKQWKFKKNFKVKSSELKVSKSSSSKTSSWIAIGALVVALLVVFIGYQWFKKSKK